MANKTIDSYTAVVTPATTDVFIVSQSSIAKKETLAQVDTLLSATSKTLTNKTLTSPVINTGVSGTAIDTDGTLAANSDTLIPSQKAVKTLCGTKVTGSYSSAAEIVTGTEAGKAVPPDKLRAAGINPLVSGTAVASTSGVAIDFTGIPAWAKRITINFDGVSTDGTSAFLVQIGDAGGFETTGYSSSAMSHDTILTSTAGFLGATAAVAAALYSGSMILSLLDASAFQWVEAGILTRSSDGAVTSSAGGKSLSAALTQVRITAVNGTDAFDAGKINILYE